jgi:cell filamentation protein
MSANSRTALERQRIEGFYTARRITELYLHPVQGKFDAAHLKEINRRIFQDLPKAGYPSVKPGEYRQAVPSHQDWVKERMMEGIPVPSVVAYSPMDDKAIRQLNQALNGINLSALSALNTERFSQAMGQLYAQLDYIHPYPDGNSRTLREFTRSLAESCGYELDWTWFNIDKHGRNVLCIARDLSVNTLALPHLRDHRTTRSVTLMLDQFAENRKLPDLLCDAIRPSRATAFAQLEEDEAMATFPELSGAYDILQAAGAYGLRKFPEDASQRDEFMASVRMKIQLSLDAGEVPQSSTNRPA